MWRAQFEGRNEHQPAVVVGLADGDLGCRVDGFLCHARPNFKRAPIDTLNDSGWFSQECAVTIVRGPPGDASRILLCRHSKAACGLLIESRSPRLVDDSPNPNRRLAR